jgi:Pyrimidine operon attenuation protein/uracil phosphoribosyltransferase
MTDSSTANAAGVKRLATGEELAGMLEKLAQAVLARHGRCEDLALIGIQRRGVILAERLKQSMAASLGHPVLSGSLDITLYRDDWTTKGPKPSTGETRIRFDVRNKVLLLVDDVLYTGRTIRAALEALTDFGRPRKVELLALVDRGHRELPIQPDYAGLTLATSKDEHVDIFVDEIDGKEGIFLSRARSGQ